MAGTPPPFSRPTSVASGVRRTALFIFGVLLATFCYAVTVRAELGLGPLFVLQDGISRHTGMALGDAVMVTGVASILLALCLRTLPGPGTLAWPFISGLFLNWVLPRLPVIHGYGFRLGAVVAATVAMALGGACAFRAAVGVSAYDSVMLALHRVTGRPLAPLRVAMELTVLVAGWLPGRGRRRGHGHHRPVHRPGHPVLDPGTRRHPRHETRARLGSGRPPPPPWPPSRFWWSRPGCRPPPTRPPASTPSASAPTPPPERAAPPDHSARADQPARSVGPARPARRAAGPAAPGSAPRRPRPRRRRAPCAGWWPRGRASPPGPAPRAPWPRPAGPPRWPPPAAAGWPTRTTSAPSCPPPTPGPGRPGPHVDAHAHPRSPPFPGYPARRRPGRVSSTSLSSSASSWWARLRTICSTSGLASRSHPSSRSPSRARRAAVGPVDGLAARAGQRHGSRGRLHHPRRHQGLEALGDLLRLHLSSADTEAEVAPGRSDSR